MPEDTCLSERTTKEANQAVATVLQESTETTASPQKWSLVMNIELQLVDKQPLTGMLQL